MKHALAWAFFVLAVLFPAASFAQNLARTAHVRVSSSRPEFPPIGVNDGNMDTSWSTALDQVKGQWLQFDWDKPQTFSGIVLYQTGPWTQTIEAQILRDGQWVTVGSAGSPASKPPLDAVITFNPVTTTSLRFLFEGGAAFYEVEVTNDPSVIRRVMTEEVLPRIDVAGDMRGHLIGTFSENSGSEGIEGALVRASGAGHNGEWSSIAHSGPNGFFKIDIPFGITGAITLEGSKGDKQATRQIDASDLSWTLTPPPLHDRIDLDGTWDWADAGGLGDRRTSSATTWQPVKVPAHWEMEGLVADSGKAVYRRFFN
ncbi:MAG TPA: discoidin domain-containing protein, partial [Fimbriimonadaceae bacterium]|nr:discoidin domain-containing protein [Fimbriimonadaceae bacterium]